MADINIEKKKSKPIWPWILGLLLLAGIIWAIAGIDSEPEAEGVAAVEEPYRDEVVNTEPQSNVMGEENQQGFVAYVENEEIKDKMGMDHQITSEALKKLASSLRDISENDNKYSQQIEEIRQHAQQIQSDPQSLQHANHAHKAFTSAADVMGQIQQDRFPDAKSEVNDVQEAVKKLKNNEPLLNQKDAVNTFFEKAADAIEGMKEEVSQS